MTIDPFDRVASLHSDIFLVWLHHFV
jgi:hypothetical protein